MDPSVVTIAQLDEAAALQPLKYPEFPRAAGGADPARKFNQFLGGVMMPWLKELELNDPALSVKASGSVITNPSRIRYGSDIDVLVFSKVLKDPEKYLSFLTELNRLALDFAQTTGVHTVFFTRTVNEAAYSFLAHSEKNGATELVPCHLLYYGDLKEFSLREHYVLTQLIMRGARLLAGTEQAVQSEPCFERLNFLQSAEWDLERTLADLVLNRDILPSQFLLQNCSDQVVLSLRCLAVGFATDVRMLKEIDIRTTLQMITASLDTKEANSLGVHELLDPVLSIREHGPSGTPAEFECVARLAVALLSGLRNLKLQ